MNTKFHDCFVKQSSGRLLMTDDFTIDTDDVTITAYEQYRIPKDRRLTINRMLTMNNGSFIVEEGGILQVNGTLVIDTILIRGDSTLYVDGILSARIIEATGNTTITFDGAVSTREIRVTCGKLEIKTNSNLRLEKIYVDKDCKFVSNGYIISEQFSTITNNTIYYIIALGCIILSRRHCLLETM